MNPILHALLGMAGLLAIAWACSERRRAIAWRPIAAGMVLQVFLAVCLLRLPVVRNAFLSVNDALNALTEATKAGTSLVFGYLGGASPPFVEVDAAASFTLAFRALPLVLVISALSSLLFYWRVLPWLVRGISWGLERAMGVGGALGLSTAANIFVGQVEAPLIIKPYLARISRGELFAVMVGGMASTSGTVLFLHATILKAVLPSAATHLLIASILSAPAAIVISFLMVPPEGEPTGGRLDLKSEAEGSMDAITRGAMDGAQLLISIVAMVVICVALVKLVNIIIAPWSMQAMLGWLLAPLAWLCGVPWEEARTGGMLLGSKTVLNEIVAYLDLARHPELSPHSRLLMTYALCGFANFGSLGIMIGGMSAMCPERRTEVVELGFRSIVAGTLATCLTAATVALLVPY